MKIYHIDLGVFVDHWKEKEDMYANERRCFGDLGELRAQSKVGTPEWEEAERAVAALEAYAAERDGGQPASAAQAGLF